MLSESDEYRALLCKCMARVPADIVDDVYANCNFIIPEPEVKGFHIPNSLIKNNDIIVFPHTLIEEPFEEIVKTVLHEIAHYVLKHKSMAQNEEMTIENGEKQEKEAWNLVNKWLSASEQ